MKKVIIVTILIILILSIWGCYGCPQRVDMYTAEEHVQRITKRLDNKAPKWRYLNDGNYDGYTVYPLYNENEEAIYFLVEIEPYGFTFVHCSDEPSPKLLYSCLGASTSMYTISNDTYGETYYSGGEYHNITWSPYIVDETRSQPYPYEDKIWILDENGERIYYNRSPYYVTGNIDERKYLIETEGGEYICAIKKDGKYINLISGEEFTVENVSQYELSKTQAYIYINYIYMGTRMNDL